MASSSTRTDELQAKLWASDQKQVELGNALELFRESQRADTEALQRQERAAVEGLERLVKQEREAMHDALQQVSARSVEDLGSLRTWMHEKQLEAERKHRHQADATAVKVDELERRSCQLGSELAQSRTSEHEAIQGLRTKLVQSQEELQDAHHRLMDTVQRGMDRFADSELRPVQQESHNVRKSLGSLVAAVMRMARVLGVLGGGEEFLDERVDGLELLDWEAEGRSLAQRIEAAWMPRQSLKVRTFVDLFTSKADTSTLTLVQMAVRDLDTRVTNMGRAMGRQEEDKDFWRKRDVPGSPPPSRPLSPVHSPSPRLREAVTPQLGFDDRRTPLFRRLRE